MNSSNLSRKLFGVFFTLGLGIVAASSASAQILMADIFDYGYINGNLYTGDGSGFISTPFTVNAGFLPFQESLTSSGLLTLTLEGTTAPDRYENSPPAPATVPITAFNILSFQVDTNGSSVNFTGGQILSDNLFTQDSITVYGSSNPGLNVLPATTDNVLLGPVGSSISIQYEVAPEPSTWALLLGGVGMLVFWRQRTRRSRS